jgi:subtilisin family serine protease
MLFCVSAGNSGIDLDGGSAKVYPACYNFDNVIAVADIRCDGELSKQSSYGKISVDVAAPGTDIVTAYPGGGYEYWSGTSIAAPLITGVAALVYAYSDKILDSSSIKSAMLNEVKNDLCLDGKIQSSGIVSVTQGVQHD